MPYNGKGNGGSMTSVKGLCSYSKNPVKAAREVAPMCGPGGNADQQKANKLLKKAQAQQDSLRGKAGM
ncbi:MAG TPA: hypothetical protein VJ327_01865 [Patescibacteria group bacterium]|nr:MAG: hypothetical protein UX14_C0023G0002 [Parcubacteria group bacterium GW2011_GWF1_45_5]HJZ04592.1 hypothetical protein [Patescibacteria group bacterium]